MDINGFDQSVFESIKADYLKFAKASRLNEHQGLCAMVGAPRATKW